MVETMTVKYSKISANDFHYGDSSINNINDILSLNRQTPTHPLFLAVRSLLDIGLAAHSS